MEYNPYTYRSSSILAKLMVVAPAVSLNQEVNWFWFDRPATPHSLSLDAQLNGQPSTSNPRIGLPGAIENSHRYSRFQRKGIYSISSYTCMVFSHHADLNGKVVVSVEVGLDRIPRILNLFPQTGVHTPHSPRNALQAPHPRGNRTRYLMSWRPWCHRFRPQHNRATGRKSRLPSGIDAIFPSNRISPFSLNQETVLLTFPCARTVSAPPIPMQPPRFQHHKYASR
jgi:hypothetical protein